MILKTVRIIFICMVIIALTVFGLYKLVTYQWQDEPQNYAATNQYITKLGDTMVSAHRTGTIYEFYDSENRTPPSCFNRKGAVVEPYDFRIKYQSIRDYGWSATLSFDMLCEI